MNVKSNVQALIKKYHTADPFEIIKGINVILVYYPLDGVRGFYQYFQRNNIIYLDKRLSEPDKKFVLAHEMGHMYLHKKANAIFMDTRTQFCTAKYELEADKFAIELLLSDEQFIEYQERGFTTEQISRMTGYSRQTIELKML